MMKYVFDRLKPFSSDRQSGVVPPGPCCASQLEVTLFVCDTTTAPGLLSFGHWSFARCPRLQENVGTEERDQSFERNRLRRINLSEALGCGGGVDPFIDPTFSLEIAVARDAEPCASRRAERQKKSADEKNRVPQFYLESEISLSTTAHN